MSALDHPKNNRRLSRRRFIQAGAAVGVGVLAGGYVKPSIRTLVIPQAFASYSPAPFLCHGLTPGYWKNWLNHYTIDEMNLLLPLTIAKTTAELDAIFIYYRFRPGRELTMIRAFLLANQLTLNLSVHPELRNPSGGFLSLHCQHEDYLLGEVIEAALQFLSNYSPGAYGVPRSDRPQAEVIKNQLMAFAELE